jgi:hypothetical protein
MARTQDEYDERPPYSGGATVGVQTNALAHTKDKQEVDTESINNVKQNAKTFGFLVAVSTTSIVTARLILNKLSKFRKGDK